MLYFTYLKNIL